MYEKERYGKRVERIGKWRKREEPKRENKSWPPPERVEGGGKGRWRKREEMEERQERRRRIWESKRAAWYARAPLPGLYGNVGQIYHSGLTVQFSYLPRAACRSTPNHPRALQGRMEAEAVEAAAAAAVSAGELPVNGRETADRGLKRPIEDLQTRCCHPLSPTSLHLISLRNLLFPSNLPQPRPPTSWLVLLLPRPPPMSLDWPTPDCGSSKMTNCLAKQSGMRNSKNTD